jgi:hypothetical protein
MRIQHVVRGSVVAAVVAASMAYALGALGSGDGATRRGTDARPLRSAPATMLAPPVANIAPLPGADPQDTVTAYPLVPRPPRTPCVVTLYNNALLGDSTNGTRAFSYAPPAGCTGAWAKVVLEADFNYDPGALSDRTAVGVWLRGVNLYFGGTPTQDEGARSPWHVERDLTDYSALLRAPGNGHALLDDEFFGRFVAMPEVFASARLLFYPAGPGAAAPRKPDVVLPLTAARPGETTNLRVEENHPLLNPDRVVGTFTLPRDVERAYLDVFAITYENDATWWSCVPSHFYDDMPNIIRNYPFGVPEEIGGCGRGAFREMEIYVDGQRAGIAPVVPWLFPDAFNNDFPVAFIGVPNPAPRTMNVLPFRVDLSPFAGVLSNGAPHTVDVRIASGEPGSAIELKAAASLLVFRDPYSTTVSGALTRNTLAGTSSLPTITENVADASGHITGDINTRLRRSFLIEGYIDTARGRIRHRVVQTSLFDITQDFDITRNAAINSYRQDIDLLSKTWRDSYSWLGPTQLRHDFLYESHRLQVLAFKEFPTSNTSDQLFNYVFRQDVHQRGVHDRSNVAQFRTQHDETWNARMFTTADVGEFNPWTWSAAQTFRYVDNRGSCFSDALSTNEWEIVDYDSGVGCAGGTNSVRWFAHPDGSADSLGWAGYQ